MSDDLRNKLASIALACSDYTTTDALDKITASLDRKAKRSAAQPPAVMPVPIGWRPNVACTPPQHFNAGQPKQQDVDYWKSIGYGIEYAYGTTAPRAFAVPEPGTPWWQTAKDCGAWTDKPDGDVGYVHFGSVEALRVYTVKITKQAQAAQAQSVPATGAQPLALDVIREAKQDAMEVFDAEGPETPQTVRDVIEYMASWLEVYAHKRASPTAPTGSAG